MPAIPVRLRTTDCAALVALCLLLTISVATKVQAYRSEPGGSGRADAAVDLGAGVVLLRGDATHWTAWVGSCRNPVTADFVDPSPHGEDAFLKAPAGPGDRVYYVYRGWTLGGRFAVTKLSALHFARRAIGVLRVGGDTARHELAIKLAIPAECAASPEGAMAALRRKMQG